MRRLTLLALTTLAACASAQASSPTRAEREEQALVAMKADAPEDLRVMSFNIKSGSFGLEKVAEAINAAHPEVVALQEVDDHTDRSGAVNQADRLGELTHMPYHQFFKATSLHGGGYGIALLSRLPVVSVEQRALPSGSHEPRTAVHAVLLADGREVSVYLTHLTMHLFDAKIRLTQSQFLTDWMAKDSRPKLLMGDLNSTPDSAPLKHLSRTLTNTFDASGKGDSGTCPFPIPGGPSSRIDHVMVSRDLLPLDSFVLHRKASDHFPLVSDIALPRTASPALVEATPRPGAVHRGAAPHVAATQPTP